jgi:hypothetical protein
MSRFRMTFDMNLLGVERPLKVSQEPSEDNSLAPREPNCEPQPNLRRQNMGEFP